MNVLKPQPKDTSLREPNRVLQLGAYSLAVVAGVTAASFKIWDQFYSKMKHTALIEPLSTKRYEDTNAVALAAKDKGMSYSEYAKQVADIETAYSKEVNKTLKHAIGIETEGWGAIKGTWQRFNTLGPYTRSNIAFTGAAAIGTTLGAYFLLNQNALLKHELRDLHSKVDEQTIARH